MFKNIGSKSLLTDFAKVPKQARAHGYWKSLNNQRQFLDSLFIALDLKEHNDWYHITVEDVKKNGGGGLLGRYGDSLIKTLKSVYPDVHFEVSKFKQVPRGMYVP